MAGDGDGEGIGAAGLGDGARGARLTELRREAGVRDGGAGRDGAQRLPDAALKGGAAHVERERRWGCALRRVDEGGDGAERRLDRGTSPLDVRVGEALREAREQRALVVAQLDGA